MPKRPEEGVKPRVFIDKRAPKDRFTNEFVFVNEEVYSGEFVHLLHNPVTGEYKTEPCNCTEVSE